MSHCFCSSVSMDRKPSVERNPIISGVSQTGYLSLLYFNVSLVWLGIKILEIIIIFSYLNIVVIIIIITIIICSINCCFKLYCSYSRITLIKQVYCVAGAIKKGQLFCK